LESANPPVRFTLGGREVALLFNWRAVRLIKEYREKIGLPPGGLLEGITNEHLGYVMWALMQNPGNGADRPALEWVEDNLDVTDIPRIEKALADAQPAPPQAPADAGKPNGSAADPFDSSKSGPLLLRNSGSTETPSGTTA
jgi:hypothetical protein